LRGTGYEQVGVNIVLEELTKNVGALIQVVRFKPHMFMCVDERRLLDDGGDICF